MSNKKKQTETSIGVFVPTKAIRRLLKQQSNFRISTLIQANEKLKLKTNLFFFSIKDVDLDNELINGVYFNVTNEQFEKKVFSFPDILYNRRSTGTRSKKVQEFRMALEKFGTKPINSVNDFNKWDVYKKLSRHTNVSSNIPFTKLLKTEADLFEMLERFNTIYVKAAKSREGKKVLKITKVKNGFQYSYFKNKPITKRFRNYKSLNRSLKQFFQNDKKILLQEAIDFYKCNGRNVEMRAEVQRNGQGKIEIVAIPVRIATVNSPIMNTRSNPKIITFEQFFLNVLKYTSEDFTIIKSNVYTFLKDLYFAIESIYGPFGELGIDFALDKNLQLWLIECNAKSAKISISRSYDTDIFEKLFINPLQYAKFLNEQ